MYGVYKSKCRSWLIMLLTINYRNCYIFHTAEWTYHWSLLWKFAHVLLGAVNGIKFVESLNTTIQSILTSSWIRFKHAPSSILRFKLMNHEHFSVWHFLTHNKHVPLSPLAICCQLTFRLLVFSAYNVWHSIKRCMSNHMKFVFLST